jgi:hypothetical protein
MGEFMPARSRFAAARFERREPSAEYQAGRNSPDLRLSLRRFVTGDRDLSMILAWMRRALDDMLDRFSEQSYNEWLDGVERIASAKGDLRSRPLGYAFQGWPFTPTHLSAPRCARCGRRARRCACSPI